MADRNSDIDNPERLEAEVRAAMFHHAQIAPRGFDSEKNRARIHREIDELLDRWATSRLLRAIANISGEKS